MKSEFISTKIAVPEYWEFEVIGDLETPEDDESIVRAVMVRTKKGPKEMHIFRNKTAVFVEPVEGYITFYNVQGIEVREAIG
jgi:hypothetical protein